MSAPAAKEERARYVRGMFARIAPRYDLMNRLMTGGQDIQWRKEVMRRAALPAGGRLLDLGAGTGDLAREAQHQYPDAQVTAGDFTLEMMLAGARRSGPPLDWAATDALNLPYPDASFDAVVSGYLLRNVVDLQRALREQYRVLKPGGRLVALDTTRPRKNWLAPFIHFYMRYVIPLLGGIITGQRDAYTYLPTTSESFLSAEELAARLAAVGFKQVGYQRRMFGTMAIHWAVKPGGAGQ
jgi:demethylmenaquinone methyltransferase/2-methoxy-6-polyprenyl-1,4-benzoquinol methylase